MNALNKSHLSLMANALIVIHKTSFMIILTINVLTAQKIPISVRYHIAANIILIRIMAIAQEEDFRVQMVYVYVPLLFLFGMEPNVFNASCLSILILIIKHV